MAIKFLYSGVFVINFIATSYELWMCRSGKQLLESKESRSRQYEKINRVNITVDDLYDILYYWFDKSSAGQQLVFIRFV